MNDQSEMSRRLGTIILSKKEAEEAVDDKLTELSCQFNLTESNIYQSSQQRSYLRSAQYKNYRVLCDVITNFHAGWMVCLYIRTGHCTIRKGLFQINAKKIAKIALGHTFKSMTQALTTLN